MLDKLSKKSKFVKRRLALRKPSFHIGRHKTLTDKQVVTRLKRVERYIITLSRNRTLFITARRFRTSEQHRSKKYWQLVVPIYGLPIKELAFRQKYSGIRRKSKTPETVVFPMKAGTYVIILLGIIGITYFGVHLQSVNSLELPSSYSLAAPNQNSEHFKPSTMAPSEPLNIRIPSINLDVKTIVVGQEADGSLEAPNILDYVTGWYKHSPTPGELGPSIITGHVDNYKGASVFWRLRELKPGDNIEIARKDGSVVKFAVSAMQQFEQDAFPSETVYGNIDHAGLRLITCGGTFDRQTGHYTANTVVFAALIENPKIRQLDDFQKVLIPMLKPAPDPILLSN